jgi:hypothetical protein
MAQAPCSAWPISTNVVRASSEKWNCPTPRTPSAAGCDDNSSRIRSRSWCSRALSSFWPPSSSSADACSIVRRHSRFGTRRVPRRRGPGQRPWRRSSPRPPALRKRWFPRQNHPPQSPSPGRSEVRRRYTRFLVAVRRCTPPPRKSRRNPRNRSLRRFRPRVRLTRFQAPTARRACSSESSAWTISVTKAKRVAAIIFPRAAKAASAAASVAWAAAAGSNTRHRRATCLKKA